MVNDLRPLGEGLTPSAELSASLRYMTLQLGPSIRSILSAYRYTPFLAIRIPKLSIQTYYCQYYYGTGKGATERIKLIILVWDAMYSAIAGGLALYEETLQEILRTKI